MNRTQTPEPLSGAFDAIRNQPPQPPAHLREQCLATVPQAELSRPRVFPNLPRLTLRLGLAAVTCAALFAVATQPFGRRSPQGKMQSVAASSAYAESVAVMRKVRFWHETTTARDINFGRGKAWTSPAPQPPSVQGGSSTYEQWFDSERGYRVRTRLTDSLYLTNGDNYFLHPEELNRAQGKCRLNLIKGSPANWHRMSVQSQAQVTDPFFSFPVGKDSDAPSEPTVTEATATYQGKAVRAYTITMTWRQRHDLDWATNNRTVVYADRVTKRFLAKRQYVSFPDFPDLGEVLSSESTFDYGTRPDKSTFDPRALMGRADSLHTVRFNEETHRLDDVAPVQRWKNAAKP